MGASSGTKLNGEKVTKHPLKPNDTIEIGKSKLIFEVKDGETIFSGADILPSAALTVGASSSSGNSPARSAQKKSKPKEDHHIGLDDTAF